MKTNQINLAKAEHSDQASFIEELQAAFAVAVVDEFGTLPDGPIPSDKILDGALNARNAEVLHILCDGRKLGGAVLTINAETHCNSLDLFFLKVGEEGRGLGTKAWQTIEQRHPETISWRTHTPYFEKRNIHFYVNKCGFKIIEFFNKYHSDPNHPHEQDDLPGDNDAFQFEKVMTPSQSVPLQKSAIGGSNGRVGLGRKPQDRSGWIPVRSVLAMDAFKQTSMQTIAS